MVKIKSDQEIEDFVRGCTFMGTGGGGNPKDGIAWLQGVRDDDLECVVVRTDVYDRVKQLLYSDTDWTDNELRRALAKSAEANGWNEPQMTAYENYDEEIRKQCR